MNALKLLLAGILSLPLLTWAHSKAHVHGLAELAVAAETGAKTALVTFEASGQAILGTEQAAKTETQKKSKKLNLERLEKSLPLMLSFEEALACVWKTKSLDVHQEGRHADIEGSFEVTCQKPLDRGTLKLSLASAFPALTTLKAQILVGTVQRSATADTKNNAVTIPLGVSAD